MIEKTPSIAPPFRRQLFEPIDQIIYNPIAHIPLRPQKKTTAPQEPVPITDGGNKFYRLSDIKKKIREEIAKKEEETRQRFLKDLKDELVINIQRGDQTTLYGDTGSPKGDDSAKNSDSTKGDDSAKNSDSSKGDESKHDDSTQDDDDGAMHLYM